MPDQPSASTRPTAREPRVLAADEREQVPDGEAPVSRLGHRKMSLHAVAVPATALLLDDVTGRDEIADDPERAALGDTDGLGDITQSRPRVAGDTEQHKSVVGEEAPGRHARKLPHH